MSAWLPSRRSTLHHVGAAVIAASGQRRSGRSTPEKGLYFRTGIRFIGFSWWFPWLRFDREEMKDLLGRQDAGGLASTRRGARLRKEQLAGSSIRAHRSPMVPRTAPRCPVADSQAVGPLSVGEHHAGGRLEHAGDGLDPRQDLAELGQVSSLDRGDDVVVSCDRVG